MVPRQASTLGAGLPGLIFPVAAAPAVNRRPLRARSPPPVCAREARLTAGSAVGAAGRRILVIMSPYPAGPRRHLATSPFRAPGPAPPAECFAVDDKVTHDKYGLGTVTGVEQGIALLIDFGTHVQRILTPSAKLSKL